MSTTTASDPRADLPPFLGGFAAMHDAMRRDAARLSRALDVPVSDREAAGLARWYDRFLAVIEHHHRREDEVVWPGLRQRDPGFAAAEEALVDDHVELDRRLHRVRAALATLAAQPVDAAARREASAAAAARREASAAAAALQVLLDEHLAREEEAAFPRIARSYTAEEYGALERELLRGTSPRQLPFEVPWVLDGVPDEQAAALVAGAPAVLRLLHRLVFQRSYRRIAAPVRGERS